MCWFHVEETINSHIPLGTLTRTPFHLHTRHFFNLDKSCNNHPKLVDLTVPVKWFKTLQGWLEDYSSFYAGHLWSAFIRCAILGGSARCNYCNLILFRYEDDQGPRSPISPMQICPISTHKTKCTCSQAVWQPSLLMLMIIMMLIYDDDNTSNKCWDSNSTFTLKPPSIYLPIAMNDLVWLDVHNMHRHIHFNDNCNKYSSYLLMGTVHHHRSTTIPPQSQVERRIDSLTTLVNNGIHSTILHMNF